MKPSESILLNTEPRIIFPRIRDPGGGRMPMSLFFLEVEPNKT